MAGQKQAASASKAQPLIHPLFAKSRFPKNVRWIKAFRKSAILATRLLDSPQAQHFVYAFLFGVNKPTTLPEKVKEKGDPDAFPFEFACDKAIGQLSAEDIAAVRQHLVELARYVRYEIGTEDEFKWAGEAERVARSSTEIPYDSCVIHISTHNYHAALYRREERTPKDAVGIEFAVAALMLHEVAHALHIVFMGPRHRMEDFFEDSLVAELGYGFVSRLFGLCPSVSTHGPRDKSYWEEWQTVDFMVDAHDDFRKIVRDLPELPEGMRMPYFKSGFAVRLADDEFWEDWAEESTRMRARLLLPRCVVDICQSDDTSGIPESIVDLFRNKSSKNSKSYAEEYYSDFANPDRIPRNAAFLTCKSGDDQEKDLQVHRSHHQGDGQGDDQEYEYGDYHEYDYGDSQDYPEDDQEDYQDYDQEYDEEKDQEDYPEDVSDDDQNDSESEDLWSEDDSDDSDSEDQESEDGQEDSDSEDEESEDEKKEDRHLG